ncbi:polymyxin B resistance protein pmrD [Salmonella enterica]|nr:polymyxin B resistance protein pmrD [Salmonella enterica]EGM2364163.1 polymyxin B resistance protein pmrD [Salmonella enterica]
MIWQVIDSLNPGTSDRCFLILHASHLKLLAEVIVAGPVFPGDILYPVQDATYLINRNEARRLRVISAEEYSPLVWRSYKKIADTGRGNVSTRRINKTNGNSL